MHRAEGRLGDGSLKLLEAARQRSFKGCEYLCHVAFGCFMECCLTCSSEATGVSDPRHNDRCCGCGQDPGLLCDTSECDCLNKNVEIDFSWQCQARVVYRMSLLMAYVESQAVCLVFLFAGSTSQGFGIRACWVLVFCCKDSQFRFLRVRDCHRP